MTAPKPDIRPLAESALLAVLGDRIDPAINARALALAAALVDASLAGVLDVVPSYASVLVAFDPEATDGGVLTETIRALVAELGDPEPPAGRTVEILVRYGDDGGPDLADVAAHAGLSPHEVVARHAAATYRVACMGFCPGFAFLLGLPPELATPRRRTPRTRVPVGSVAIGGAQAGVYPLETPGGWNVVGHTDVQLFDPNRPDPILLRPGDRVRFAPVEGGAGEGGGEPTGASSGAPSVGDRDVVSPGPDESGATRMRLGEAGLGFGPPRADGGGHDEGACPDGAGTGAEDPGLQPRAENGKDPEGSCGRIPASTTRTVSPPLADGNTVDALVGVRWSAPDRAAAADVPSPTASPPRSNHGGRDAPSPPSDRRLEILAAPGIVTVQDLGRPGLMHLGVTPGGALDRRALVLGNRLLGNDPGSAAIECALAGPTIRFGAETLVAVTGADFGPQLDGADISLWTPIRARAGAVLSFARPAQPGAGLRCYVCVEGGVAVTPVMGSRSTDLFGRFGGLGGRPLRAGDALPLGPSHAAADGDAAVRRRLMIRPPEPVGMGPLRVVLGPHEARFGGEAMAAFLSGRFAVDPRSDRMGLRLRGPAMAPGPGPEPISEGIAAGAVQVPPDGQPILLTPARQTIGGYPRIATIVGADLDRLGQLATGDGVRFAAVDAAAARAVTLTARARLGPDAVRELPRAFVLAPGVAAEALGWDEAALGRVAKEARRAGVRSVAVDAPGVVARIAVAPPLPLPLPEPP